MALPGQRGGDSQRCWLGAWKETLGGSRESRLGDRGAGGRVAGWQSTDPGSVSSLKKWRRHKIRMITNSQENESSLTRLV